MSKRYDYRNCQSLFGYAKKVHQRSGGICQLCGCGMGIQSGFDLWRQMTVEHLIGESQGGDLKRIKEAIAKRFPKLSYEEHEKLANLVHDANTVTACRFCNSTTSRYRHTKGMDQLINEKQGTSEEVVESIKLELKRVLGRKRASVRWKLHSVKDAFEKYVRPNLQPRKDIIEKPFEIIKRDGSKLDTQLTHLFQLAKDIRASFLEQSIFIEKIIEDILAHHFCPEEDRRNLFFSLVINGTDLTFDSKICIFDKLLRLRYPDIIESNNKLIDELHKIRRFRNRLAHAMLDTSPDFLAKEYKDRIQLIYYEDGRKKQQVITTTERIKRLSRCSKIVQLLYEIKLEIIKRIKVNE